MKWVIRTARYDTGKEKPVFEKGKFTVADVRKRGCELAAACGIDAADIKISVTFTGSAQVFIDKETPGDNNDETHVQEV